MNRLDHHDGIIDHNRNRQQQGGQRKQVDGESENPEEEERTNQSHRYSNHRNQRRTEVLQEDIHYDEHQYQGDDQGEDNLLNRCEQELSNIHQDDILQPRRITLLQFIKRFLYVACNLGSIGTGNLLNHTHYGRLTIVEQVYIILQTTQLNLGNFTEAESLTGSIALDKNVLILQWSLQTTLVTQGIFILHIRALTKATRGSLDILLCQSLRNIRRNQSELLHLLWLQPDTHRVVTGRRALHITHTIDTLQLRNDVDQGVVGNKLVVVTAIVCSQSEHDYVGTLTLGYGDTHPGNLGRQQRLRLRHTVLYIDRSHIRVGTLLEVNGNLSETRVRRRRGHIGHVLHTVDTLLQRSNDRVQHRLGICTRIGSSYRDGRRRDIRILLNRQRYQADDTQQDEEDGNHRRKYRALYKVCK